MTAWPPTTRYLARHAFKHDRRAMKSEFTRIASAAEVRLHDEHPRGLEAAVRSGALPEIDVVAAVGALESIERDLPLAAATHGRSIAPRPRRNRVGAMDGRASSSAPTIAHPSNRRAPRRPRPAAGRLRR